MKKYFNFGIIIVMSCFLGGCFSSGYQSPEDYEKWLPHFGFKTMDVRLAPKDAVFNGCESFATWLRTTWLPYIQRVPEDLREEFIAAVTERYVAKHPPDAENRVHVRMVRLEIDAVKL